MVAERARAAEMGYESPIMSTIEDTHRNFDECVNMVLDNNDMASILVASHNQASIEMTLQQMRERAIDPATGGVSFGQLLGMAGHLTFNLGANGYNAFKYVPYGPVKEVVPYLVRRAQENSDLMGGTGKELGMLWAEIRRRKYFLSA